MFMIIVSVCSFCIERFTADATDGFSRFLYNLGREAKTSVEKQQKDIETTVKTVVEATDAFLRSVDSKRSASSPAS